MSWLASSIISRRIKSVSDGINDFRLYHFHFFGWFPRKQQNEQQDFSLKIIIFLVFSNERKLKRLGNYSIHRERDSVDNNNNNVLLFSSLFHFFQLKQTSLVNQKKEKFTIYLTFIFFSVRSCYSFESRSNLESQRFEKKPFFLTCSP